MLLAACKERVVDASPRVPGAEAFALNASLVVRLGAEPDPLSVTGDAVHVADGRGWRLPARTHVEGRNLVARLVIDASLLDDPPDEVQVSVVGGASLVGLCARDGTPMASITARFAMRASLVDAPGGRLDLRAVAGVSSDGRSSREVALRAIALAAGDGAAPEEVLLEQDERLALRFAGVLDPSGLGRESVPLFPVGAAGELPPVHPDSRWTIVGTSSELLLDLTGQVERLRFKSRRMTLRSISGREAEPRVEFLVRRLPER